MMEAIQNPNKRFKVFLFVFGLILLISLILSLLTVTTATLTTFKEGVEEYEHTMLECTSCPIEYERSSYACLKSRECSGGSDSLCSTGKALTYGKWYLFVTELLSLICSVLALGKLVYMYLDTDIGRPFELYVCISLLFLSKIIGLVLFFSLGDVKLPTNCSDADICAGTGGILIVLNAVFAFFIMICGLIHHKTQGNYRALNVYQSEEMRPHIIKSLMCLILSLALWFTSQFLRWFSYEDSKTRKGSLMALDKYEMYDDIEYSCISSMKCASNDEKDCDAFSDLSDASMAYFYIEMACGLIFSSWLENLIQIALKRRSFIKSFSLGLAWLGSIGNIVSLAVWMEISKVSFGSDCDISRADTELSFCADIGLVVALVGAFSFLLTATYYTIILINLDRKSISPPIIPTFTKNRVNSPATIIGLEDKGQMNDTNTDFYTQHNNSTVGENVCKSCMGPYTNTQVRVGKCGHILHAKCRERTDGNLPCRKCRIS